MAYSKINGLDGHFWVEREGKIIDTTPFPIKVGDVGFTGELVYLPANALIQAVMIKAYSVDIIISFNKKYENLFGAATTTSEVWERQADRTPKARQCPQNASFEAWKNGGTVVFGSLGYKADWTPEINYEYGGPDYLITDFLSKTTTKRDAATDKVMKGYITHLASTGLSKAQILKKLECMRENE